MKKILAMITMSVLLFTGTHVIHANETKEKSATVFFNESCMDCGKLVKETYPTLFAEYGYNLAQKDYINERETRKILTRFNDEWNVPFDLQSHIETFVGDRLLIGGHVPIPVIRYVLEHPDAYEKLLIYQDKMHGDETEYKVWNFKDEIKTYPINEPIETYFKEAPQQTNRQQTQRGFWSLFTIVTGSAFLDGLNPCAFAVLLFFIGFLFTLKKSRASICKMGLVYIGAIFLAYFLIGIGIAQAIVISGAPHMMATIGAWLVIALGVIQSLGILFPSFPIRLRIPVNTKATLEKWMYKATLPASFIGGFLVGLCTFPCSGGIYVAIIGLLATSNTAVQGTIWMLWYNLIFVAPLIILLALASNRKTTEQLEKLERSESIHIKLLIGGFMIVLGVIILLFFT